MLGLSFLSPLFLAGALAAAVPIAIHLFHRRTEPVVDFAAMRFLRRAPVEHSMLLEDQAVSAQDSQAQLDEFLRETSPSRLWDVP